MEEVPCEGILQGVPQARPPFSQLPAAKVLKQLHP